MSADEGSRHSPAIGCGAQWVATSEWYCPACGRATRERPAGVPSAADLGPGSPARASHESERTSTPAVGRVQAAATSRLAAGTRLPTPTGRGMFVVSEIKDSGIVLLLGAQRARTVIPWRALEGIPEFLRGRGWVMIGSVFDTEADASTLDGYLKGFVNRATAGWVAVVLERSGVVEIDRGRPARLRVAQRGT